MPQTHSIVALKDSRLATKVQVQDDLRYVRHCCYDLYRKKNPPRAPTDRFIVVASEFGGLIVHVLSRSSHLQYTSIKWCTTNFKPGGYTFCDIAINHQNSKRRIQRESRMAEYRMWRPTPLSALIGIDGSSWGAAVGCGTILFSSFEQYPVAGVASAIWPARKRAPLSSSNSFEHQRHPGTDSTSVLGIKQKNPSWQSVSLRQFPSQSPSG